MKASDYLLAIAIFGLLIFGVGLVDKVDSIIVGYHSAELTNL